MFVTDEDVVDDDRGVGHVDEAVVPSDTDLVVLEPVAVDQQLRLEIGVLQDRLEVGTNAVREAGEPVTPKHGPMVPSIGNTQAPSNVAFAPASKPISSITMSLRSRAAVSQEIVAAPGVHVILRGVRARGLARPGVSGGRSRSRASRPWRSRPSPENRRCRAPGTGPVRSSCRRSCRSRAARAGARPARPARNRGR